MPNLKKLLVFAPIAIPSLVAASGLPLPEYHWYRLWMFYVPIFLAIYTVFSVLDWIIEDKNASKKSKIISRFIVFILALIATSLIFYMVFPLLSNFHNA